MVFVSGIYINLLLRIWLYFLQYLRSFKYMVKSFGNMDNFVSSFSPLCLLFLSLALFDWLGIHALYWITVRRVETPVSFLTLVLILEYFSISYDVDYFVYHIKPLLCWCIFLFFVCLFRAFILEGHWISSKDFYSSIETVMCYFSLILFMCCIIHIDFSMLNHTCMYVMT
jgi:hypothetical protein